MGSNHKSSKGQNAIIDLLGILIVEIFQDKCKELKEEIGIKELLKMIEVHQKLSPVEPGNKKFWEMLNKIRQNNLDEKKEISPPKTRRKSSSGKVKAA